MSQRLTPEMAQNLDIVVDGVSFARGYGLEWRAEEIEPSVMRDGHHLVKLAVRPYGGWLRYARAVHYWVTVYRLDSDATPRPFACPASVMEGAGGLHLEIDWDLECEDGVRITAEAMGLSDVDEWAGGRHFDQCGPVVATPEIRFRDLVTNCGRGFERAARPAALPVLTRPMWPPFWQILDMQHDGISLRQRVDELLRTPPDTRVSVETIDTRILEYLEQQIFRQEAELGVATEPDDPPCPECTYAPQGMGCLPTCEHFVCAACERGGNECACVPNV